MIYNFGKKKFFLEVSTYLAVVLDLFNEYDELSWQMIAVVVLIFFCYLLKFIQNFLFNDKV